MPAKTTQETSTNVPAESVVESSAEFRNGVCSGYLSYYDDCQGKLLTEVDVYNFLAQNIADKSGTDQFNAGYCTGWIEALVEDRKLLYSSPTSPLNEEGKI